MDNGDAAGPGARGGITAELFRTQPGQRHRLTEEAREALRQLSRPSSRSGGLSALAYNLTISHRHRFLWFRVAKVGTRTILGYFQEHQVPLDVEHVYRMRYPTALFTGYLKFAFVRHPVGRFVSAWHDKVVNNNYFGFDHGTHARMREHVEAFAAWVAGHDLADLAEADTHLALQSRLVDLSHVDFLGRLETFDADFAEVCGRLGLPGVRPTALNRTATSRSTKIGPSAELQAAVAEMYRKDFQVFGYDPAQPG